MLWKARHTLPRAKDQGEKWEAHPFSPRLYVLIEEKSGTGHGFDFQQQHLCIIKIRKSVTFPLGWTHNRGGNTNLSSQFLLLTGVKDVRRTGFISIS